MDALLVAILAGVGFVVAYHTYGRWLGRRIFDLATAPGKIDPPTPAHALRDDVDYCPTNKWVVFGHHFTSIAGTGPIVGPAIAVIWGWLPALLWVVFGSIFIGAVHDLGSLVVSLRHRGQTVGEIAGELIHPRVRVLFLAVLFLALTIVLAIFGLVIAAVFRMYPQAILPCLLQIPIAIAIGALLHRNTASRGVSSISILFISSSLAALAVMYLTVILGDWGPLHAVNVWLAGIDNMTWCLILLAYSGVASVLPVWLLLQPRDYINSLQLISSMGLIVVGLVVAAMIGGAPPVPGAERQPLEIVAPMVRWEAPGAPFSLIPFLFITIACGAISGFHCMVSSGTSSKQLDHERDARCVGYGAMLTEGFLATLVILGCVAGLGLGWSQFDNLNGQISYKLGSLQANQSAQSSGYHTYYQVSHREGESAWVIANDQLRVAVSPDRPDGSIEAERILKGGLTLTPLGDWVSIAPGIEARHRQLIPGDINVHPNVPIEVRYQATGSIAWQHRYAFWSSANGLGAKVGAFIDGAGNFLKAMGVPASVATALLAVLVASFAGTTLDTATRLQRYVVQGLANSFAKPRGPYDCERCGYDLRGQTAESGSSDRGAGIVCPECGGVNAAIRDRPLNGDALRIDQPLAIRLLSSPIGATLVAVLTAAALAAIPAPGKDWSWANAGGGGLILWPMFGATNQLLGGLAFMVIAFYLLRCNKPTWFLVVPAVFMLVMPAWALAVQLPGWWGEGRYVLLGIAAATLALEAWMIVEAARLLPRVRGLDVGKH